MSNIVCHKCNSELDVSTLAPGTDFSCGGCGAVLSVGAGEAAPSAAETKPAPRRARREKPETPPKKSASMPLVVGGIVVMALAIVGVLAVTSGNGDEKTVLQDEGSGEEEASPTPEKTLTPEEREWAEAVTGSRREEVARKRAQVAKHSDDEAKALHAFLLAEGERTLARVAAEARLEADADSAWANGILERVSVRAALEPLADRGALLDEHLIPAWERLRSRVRSRTFWVSASEQSAVESDVAEVSKHLTQLEDPWYRSMLKVVAEVRASPAFKPFTPIDYVAAKPYVVLVQRNTGKTGQNTKNVLQNHANLFRCLTTEFLGKMKEAGLPDVTIADMGNPVLKAFVFVDRNSFERWHWNQGAEHDALKGIGAYYAWGSNQFMMMNDKAPEGTQDPHTCTAFHEGTHQLVHYYRRHYLWMEMQEEDPNAPQPPLVHMKLHGNSHFFGEGFAEFVGTADRISSITGEWKLFRLSKQRMSEWGSPKVRRSPEWTTEQVLRMRSSREMAVLAPKVWPGFETSITSLYYAQSWSLHHFLYFGEDGAWRKRYLDYIHQEMRCKSGYDVFLKCFGVGKDPSERKAFIKDLEKRWYKYAHEAMFKNR